MERTLFLADRPLFSFSFDASGKFSVTKIHEEDLSFWPHLLQKDQSPELCKEWLGNRITPVGRKLLTRIREASKVSGVLGYLTLTRGLSLNDAFWIGEDGETFRDFNLYENPLSPEIAQLAFSTDTARAAAFFSRSPEYSSEGAMRKCWVRRGDNLFLMKADDWQNSGGYSQVFAEYFASISAEAFGISHVSYSLELHEKSDNKGYDQVCLCPLFTSLSTGFVPASVFFRAQGIPERKLLQFWLENPEEHEKLMQIFDRKFYEDMLVFDALIGNEDRHLNNFGYFVDNVTNRFTKPSPLFDHGLSLLASVIGREHMTPEECASISSRGTFLAFDSQIAAFVRPRHRDAIIRVMNLEFKQHPDFALDDRTIERINDFKNLRCQIALDIVEKLACEGKKRLSRHR